MSTRRKRSKRLLVTVLFAGVLASAAYAFTASNTVPGSTAGQGATAISGYSATSVAYGLNATTPSNIDSVSFTLAPAAAATVKIQLVSSGSWYSCTNTAGSVTCATTSPQATVSAANNLTVLAVQ
jgi:hypothetical protein